MPEVSGSRLAELTGHGWRTIKARLEQAAVRPIRRERNADLFDSAVALAAIYGAGQTEAEFDDQRERLAAAQAEKYETENAVRRGELAEVHEVVRVVQDHIAAARAKLLAVPSKLAPQLAGIHDPNVIAAGIRAEISAALGELSNYDAASAGSRADAGRVEDVGAAAGPDGKPVGRPRKKAQQRKRRRAGPVED